MKILMYFDGTEHAMESLPLVIKHAKAFQAGVDVVSSMPKAGEEQIREIEDREGELEYLKEALAREKIPSETHLLIRGHDAGADIIEFAREHQVDEIVIGTEKKSMLQNFILGSVSQHVISHASCPVVIV
jgi:nucleotide-binding universal stress UspA family protein